MNAQTMDFRIGTRASRTHQARPLPRRSSVPCCPVDRVPLNATIVGWRCPICGIAGLPRSLAVAAR